jgi:hypothetical protein
MASSEPLAASWSLMFSRAGLCCRRSREGPHFTLRVCSRRAISLTPAARAAAGGYHFAARRGLRLLRTGSATAGPRAPVPARRLTGLISSLALRPDRIASPAPARTFTFELAPPESPRRGVEYHYTGRQPVPAAGLAPARRAALWAADGVNGGRTEKTANISARMAAQR